MKLPISAHGSALGGINISTIKDDATLGFSNPALLSSVSDKTLNLNYMSYFGDSKMLSASFVKIIGERHTIGLYLENLNYGSMDETDEQGTILGEFSTKDMLFHAGYSYLLNDYWAGGAAIKFIDSQYADYSSLAFAIDVGINYYDENKNFSASFVVKNVGLQIKKFEDLHENLPYDVEAGITFGATHSPLNFSITMVDLTRWDDDYYYKEEDSKDSFSKKLLNHFVIGVDLIPTRQFYLSVGYNFLRGNELKAAGSSHGAGFSFGGGLNLNKFKLDISYSKYHVSSSSLLFNLSYVL